MEADSVPQDSSSTYANNKKAIYAKDQKGKIRVVGSSGWIAEETVTKQALSDLEERALRAYCMVKSGEKSPLYYYMYAERMDLDLLAQSTGFFKWRVKRDFKPNVYAKISEKRLRVYADALGRSVENLRELEEQPYVCE